MAEQSTIEKFFDQYMQGLLDSLMNLKSQLSERLLPVTESLKPIWEDPVWQFIGLVVLVVFVVLMMIWALRMGGRFVEGVFSLLLSPFVMIKNLFKGDLGKAILQRGQATKKKINWRVQNAKNTRQAIDALRYLTTRRDWRYQTSWYLLAGHDDSGKNEWIRSVKNGRRTQLQVKEQQLISKGSHWHFFDQGVVIEAENEDYFSEIVGLLNFYRPERSVDGVILTVSAKALRNVNDPSDLKSLGEVLYRQLWVLQKYTGLVVPVYLIVTECHTVRGFGSFWSALQDGGSDEMFGWSNPHRIDMAFSSRWVNDAFDSVMNGLMDAQLKISASGKEIPDRDGFILFDQEFNRLREPLKEVINHAFTRSSFQESLPLRGVWFSGSLNDEVILTEDFFSHKLWPETNLAYPIEQRRFSSNRTLRRCQYLSYIAAIFLVLLMLSDSYRLNRYSAKVTEAMGHMESSEERRQKANDKNSKNVNVSKIKDNPGCGDSRSQTWWLLGSLSKLSDEPWTFSLPASLVWGQAPKLQRNIATKVFPLKLFPSLDCRLKFRADALDPEALGGIQRTGSLKQLIDELHYHINLLERYQKNQATFVHLAGPLQDARGVGSDLRGLLDYLYDGSIPSAILFDSPLIAGAVVETAYDIEWGEKELVKPIDQLDRLIELAKLVREKIEEQALEPPLEAIQKAFLTTDTIESHGSAIMAPLSSDAMRKSIDDFERWYSNVDQYWLSSRPESSHCGLLYKELHELVKILQSAAYSESQLEKLITPFKHDNCDKPIRYKLSNLNKSPLGDLFEQSASGSLKSSKGLVRWVEELKALEALNLLSQNVGLLATSDTNEASGEANVGKIVSWKGAPLDEALKIILSFQNFRQKWWEISSNSKTEPFYAPALRVYLQRIVHSLIQQAQVREISEIKHSAKSDGDIESIMAGRIANFKRVDTVLRQLIVLLRQEGNSNNAVFLINSSREFVSDQLLLLEKLNEKNKLYQPFSSPRWSKENFAGALFGYTDAEELASYLENQRQRTDYFSQNYARPLISFLLDSGGVSTVDKSANVWLDTLADLRRYRRKEPGNGVDDIENFISKDLAKMTASDCNTRLAEPMFTHTSGGFFNVWHAKLDKNIRKHCEILGKTKIIKQYLSLAERFNDEFSGKYPFSVLSEGANYQADPDLLSRFLDDFRKGWLIDDAQKEEASSEKNLLAQLKSLINAQPNLVPNSWLTFIHELKQLSDFWVLAEGEDGKLNVPLNVEFAALPEQSVGSRQIVEWQLTSGATTLSYPNGGEMFHWQPGDKMRLSLRWASGSEFAPTRYYQTPVQIDVNNKLALFSSDNRWSLFEWLQTFGDLDASTSQSNVLTFQVPVTSTVIAKNSKNGDRDNKASNENAEAIVSVPDNMGDLLNNSEQIEQPLAYMSRVNLRLNVAVTLADGSQKILPLPTKLPRFAPGVSGKQKTGGGDIRAASTNYR